MKVDWFPIVKGPVSRGSNQDGCAHENEQKSQNMNNQTILLLLLLCFIRNIENIEPISSKVQSERVEKLRCEDAKHIFYNF